MVQQGERSLSVRRLLVAAGVSLVAALGFGFAPVEQGSVVYEFRPSATASGATGAVASLALAPRLEPDSLDLRLSCEVRAPASVFRSMNLGVWQAPERGAVQSPLAYESLGDAAVVTVGGGELSLVLGEDQLLTIPVSHGLGCVARVGYAEGVWRVSTVDQERVVQAAAPSFADVSFEGPAATNPDSVVTVAARELGSSPSSVQYLFLVVALGALLLAAREVVAVGGGSPGVSTPGASRLRSSLGALGVVDAGVFGMLVVWAFVIPAAFDDGWLLANATGQEPFEGLNVFFQQGLAEFLWGYWVGWLQHLWFGLSSSPVVLRLPNVLLGVVTWIGLRSIARSLGFPRRGSWLWVMGAVFVVGYGAWGMSFRFEPVVAALLVASLALALRFASGQRGWVLVVWPAVLALALNAHPTGLVVLAPVLVVWRDIRDWVRTNRRVVYVALSVLMMLGAATLLLYAWDSNLPTQLDGIRLLRSGTHRRFIFEDTQRYRALVGTSMLRRVSVVLMLFGVVVFLMRRYARGGVRARPRDLPVWSLIGALGLLALVPSKHTWHFGVFVGVAALAVASALRPDSSDSNSNGRGVFGFSGPMVGVLLVGLAGALAWAFSSTEPWALFDLRIQRWWEGAENVLPFSLASPVTWLVLAGGIGGAVWASRRWGAHRSRWPEVDVFVVVAASLAVAITASTFVIDAVRTDGWTFAGSNVESLFGSAGCGLGDDIRVPAPGSLYALVEAPAESLRADAAAAEAGFDDAGGFVAGAFPLVGVNGVLPLDAMAHVGSWGGVDGTPESNLGGYRSPWHVVGAQDDAVALMVMGGFDGPGDNVVGVQWGSVSDSGVESLAVERAGLRGRFSDWTMVTFDVPDGADRVRMLVRDNTAGAGVEGWVAASLPLGLSYASLGSVVEATAPVTFVTPALAPHLPCVGPTVTAQPLIPPAAIMIREVPDQDYVVWPRADRAAPYLAAAATDRYFSTQAVIPPQEADDRVEVVISQEYLTGRPARTTGTFQPVSP